MFELQGAVTVTSTKSPGFSEAMFEGLIVIFAPWILRSSRIWSQAAWIGGGRGALIDCSSHAFVSGRGERLFEEERGAGLDRGDYEQHDDRQAHGQLGGGNAEPRLAIWQTPAKNLPIG